MRCERRQVANNLNNLGWFDMAVRTAGFGDTQVVGEAFLHTVSETNNREKKERHYVTASPIFYQG